MHVELPYPSLASVNRAGVPALTDDALFAACGVRVLFTGRDGGVSEGEYASLNCGSGIGDDEGAVERNRRLVCEAAGAGSCSLVVPRQVHGTDLAYSGAGDAHPVADGVLCDELERGVMLCFADCLPLIIVSPTGRFAVVHAGWRGAVAHIAAKAASALAQGDAAPPSGYNAYIGAHIHSECFEVGAEVEARFRTEFGAACVFAPRHVSLAAAVTADLESAGFDSRRIADVGICTRCHPKRFFSYRATSGSCGRHSAFAVRLRAECASRADV